MVSIDSSLAGPMKPQVLTTMTSASLGSAHDAEALAGADAEHDLGVDPVLRASEGDEVDGLLRLRHGSVRCCPTLGSQGRPQRATLSDDFAHCAAVNALHFDGRSLPLVPSKS